MDESGNKKPPPSKSLLHRSSTATSTTSQQQKTGIDESIRTAVHSNRANNPLETVSLSSDNSAERIAAAAQAAATTITTTTTTNVLAPPQQQQTPLDPLADLRTEGLPPLKEEKNTTPAFHHQKKYFQHDDDDDDDDDEEETTTGGDIHRQHSMLDDMTLATVNMPSISGGMGGGGSTGGGGGAMSTTTPTGAMSTTSDDPDHSVTDAPIKHIMTKTKQPVTATSTSGGGGTTPAGVPSSIQPKRTPSGLAAFFSSLRNRSALTSEPKDDVEAATGMESAAPKKKKFQLPPFRSSNKMKKKTTTSAPSSSHSSSSSSSTKAHYRYTQLGILCVIAVVLAILILIPLLDKLSRSMGELVKESVFLSYPRGGPVLFAQMSIHPSTTTALNNNNNSNQVATTSTNPMGKITLRFHDDDRFLVLFRMEGLEESCIQCPFAILEGTSCESISELGTTEYYDRNSPLLQQQQGPYLGRAFYTSEEGLSFSTVSLWIGYGADELENHALVIYGTNRIPISCGVLKRQSTSTALLFDEDGQRKNPIQLLQQEERHRLWADIIPTTTTAVPAATTAVPQEEEDLSLGKVRLEFYNDNSFLFHFDLKGLPSNCIACGISIYQTTTSCPLIGITNDAINHFWNPHVLQSDPWNPSNGAFYTSDVNGTAHHFLYLYNGYAHDEHYGHAVILHDQTNTMIACGILWNHSKDKEQEAPGSPTPTPTTTTTTTTMNPATTTTITPATATTTTPPPLADGTDGTAAVAQSRKTRRIDVTNKDAFKAGYFDHEEETLIQININNKQQSFVSTEEKIEI